MKKYTLRSFLIVVCSLFFLINSALIFLIFFPIQQKQEVPEIEYPELPQLYITLNETNLDEINSGNKEARYPGNSLTFLVDKEYYDFSNVEIKGRGNKTWSDADKKPYQIKFDSKENLFGFGKAKKWVLLANYFDEGYIRNDLAFYIANLLNMDYTNDGKFVELYIDNEYLGLYYLTQKIGINSASVDIKDKNAVLMELDNIYYAENEKHSVSLKGDVFVLKDSISDDKNIQKIAVEDFMNNYSAFEKAVESKDWKRIQEIVDIESFAKFYIIQDFSLNWDSFATSTYFYKDGFGDKIHAGPIWDLDNAFGRWLETMFYRRDLQYNGTNAELQSDTFFKLMEIKEFRELISEIVNRELLPKRDLIFSRIDSISEQIASSALRDNEKWGRNNYFDEVLKIKNAVQRRFDYYSIFYANEERLPNGNYLFKNLNTEFKIESVEAGGYKIARTSDGRALTVDESYNEYGTVSFHSYKDSVWQRWYICRDNEGKYYLFSVATESVLMLDQDGVLRTRPLSRGENEQFEIAEIGTFPLDTFVPKN